MTYTTKTYGAYTDSAPVLPGYVNISDTVDDGVRITVRSDGGTTQASFDMTKAAAVQLFSAVAVALTK